ncbi:hypothetical protein N9E52_05050 [Alphaproteobacteria bacterium]|nr:hypothetical protein [Alphaproteobacteria bacterium]
MVFRLLLFVFLFTIKIGYTNIVYDKNNILITDIEIKNYLNLYKNNFGNSISNNEAIKNIVILKKTINFLQENNYDFLSNLDAQIKKEYPKEIFNNPFILNFIRFQKIRNEFIAEYYNNKFSIEDLENIFSNFGNLKVPISKNNCLTIEKLHEAGTDKIFIESFFENLKKKQQNTKTVIKGESYDVCMDINLFSSLENEIIKFIHDKTEKDFNDFIYGKVN